jgi:hypothetical protein
VIETVETTSACPACGPGSWVRGRSIPSCLAATSPHGGLSPVATANYGPANTCAILLRPCEYSIRASLSDSRREWEKPFPENNI